MRFLGFVACLVVGIDSAQMAVGAQPQNLISDNALWVYWIAFGGWMIGAVRFAFQKEIK